MATQNIVHLQLIDTDEHYYFGSTKALCEMFGKDVIGITYGSLCSYVTLHGFPFRNKKCIIRKGEFYTKSRENKGLDEKTNPVEKPKTKTNRGRKKNPVEQSL